MESKTVGLLAALALGAFLLTKNDNAAPAQPPVYLPAGPLPYTPINPTIHLTEVNTGLPNNSTVQGRLHVSGF